MSLVSHVQMQILPMFFLYRVIAWSYLSPTFSLEFKNCSLLCSSLLSSWLSVDWDFLWYLALLCTTFRLARSHLGVLIPLTPGMLWLEKRGLHRKPSSRLMSIPTFYQLFNELWTALAARTTNTWPCHRNNQREKTEQWICFWLSPHIFHL